MKYKFSSKALISMKVAIGGLSETSEIRQLYNKLDGAFPLLGVFRQKIELSPREIALIKQGLGKSDETIGQWGYQARKEITQIG